METFAQSLMLPIQIHHKCIGDMIVQSGITVRFLSLSDILKVGLTLKDAVDLVETSFSEHGQGHTENPPKLPIHPQPDAFINAMPAFLPRKKAAGLKWVAGFPANVPKGLPTITGMIILNDPETGFPIAFMDGTYITAIRTVAASVVAAKRLHHPKTEVMGLVGCGVQGKYHAIALKSIIPSIRTMRIYDQFEPAVSSFVKEIQPEIPDVSIEVQTSCQDALSDTDLVVTATGKLLDAIYESEWVKEGALVLPVHTLGWSKKTPSAMDKLITDDWKQYLSGASHAYSPLPDAPFAETGEIVAGLKPGRESETERIICFNKGLAIHDVMMASFVHEKAKEMNLGTMLTVQESDQDIPLLK